MHLMLEHAKLSSKVNDVGSGVQRPKECTIVLKVYKTFPVTQQSSAFQNYQQLFSHHL